jgi:hypothetical protein
MVELIQVILVGVLAVLGLGLAAWIAFQRAHAPHIFQSPSGPRLGAPTQPARSSEFRASPEATPVLETL